MKSKLIILILLLPIILMFSLFSVSKASALIIDTPISSIEAKIYDGTTFFSNYLFDLAAKEEKELYIIPYIYPISVKSENKTISFEYENVSKSDKSDPNNKITLTKSQIEIEGIKYEAYLIKCIDIGSLFIRVKCQTYVSTVEIDIISTSPLGISNILVLDSTHKEKDLNDIFTGDYLYFDAQTYPTLDNKELSFYSSDQEILSVDEITGFGKAKSNGICTITVKLNNSVNGIVEKNITLNIKKSTTITDILIEGKQDNTASLIKGSKIFKFSGEVDISDPLINSSNPILVKESIYFTVIGNIDYIYLSEKIVKYTIVIEIVDNIQLSEFEVILRTNSTISDFDAFFSILTIELKDFESLDLKIYGSSVVRKNASYTYQIEGINNDTLHYVFITSNSYDITSNSRLTFKNEGEIEIKVNIYSKVDGIISDTIIGVLSKVVNVVNPYSALSFVENTMNLGLSGTLALGNKNGSFLEDNYPLNNSVKSGIEYVDTSKIIFISSDDSIALVIYENNIPYLKIIQNGSITLTVKDKDSILLEDIVSSTITLTCVDGINAYSEADLKAASLNKYQIVLRNSISIGESYLNESKTALKPDVNLASIYEYQKINETYDHTFYLNIKNEYKIYYLFEINNNLFGNGYKIDTHTISYLALKTSFAENLSKCIFKGPLDLVRLGDLASVKSQDNINFLVRTTNDKLIIDNVELDSFDPLKIKESSFNLNELNNCGTTLEVMSDNVYITNSRIGFGRNTVRVFGESKVHSKESPNYQNNRINVYLYGDILSYSREFLLKIGANDYLLAKKSLTNETEDLYSSASPYLKNDSNDNYQNYNNPTNLSNLNDEYFVQNYLKTVVTVKDCAFINSGLFVIGIESHFSGPVLNDYKIPGVYTSQMENWKDVSGTSFASLLKLEGEVLLYDWKSIDLIDSSTLIELISNNDEQLSSYLSFDIKQILLDINEYVSNPLHTELEGVEDFSKCLIYDYSMSTYFAHGGIVFYGGGKNYSMFDNQSTNLLNNELVQLKIKLSDISNMGVSGGTLYNNLRLAAGREAFNFFMNGSESTLTPQTQKNILNNNRINITRYDINEIL